MTETFHRRELPAHLIALASPEGRRLFAEALAAGTMEGYFPVAEQFQTQSEPAYCGLTSLTVMLNSLGIDPGRTWKGPWRWFSEEMLDCCVGLDEIRARGITADELACLARCNGADSTLRRADRFGIDDLRADVIAAAGDGPRVLAAYGRRALDQTGDGHYSPIGGYHAARDLVLLLDVARFKYPPHWVPLATLHTAMATIDPATGHSRGWIVLARAPRPPAFAMSVQADRLSWATIAETLERGRTAVAAAVAGTPELRSVARAWLSGVRTLGEAIGFRELIDPALAPQRDALKAELVAGPAGALARELAPPLGLDPAIATLLLIVPPADAVAAAGPVAAAWRALRDSLSPGVAEQLALLDAQLAAVVASAPCCRA